jgi:hypothetical protein
MNPNCRRDLFFRDHRPPHQIQFLLERELMVPLRPVAQSRPLRYAAQLKMGSMTFSFELAFLAASPHYYSLAMDAVWPDPDDCAASADSWFQFWTRELTPVAGTPAATTAESLSERYELVVRDALTAEAHLTDVPAIQRAILMALRNGATYRTAHKEGGTTISYFLGRFLCTDYGESSDVTVFASEAKFLAFLRRFHDWQISHQAAAPVAEYDAWKLMLRLLDSAGPSAAGRVTGRIAKAIRSFLG